MKKSSFIALLLSTVSGISFSLGMCMALLPEWNAFSEGVILGGVGLALGIITLAVWCRMEGKRLPSFSGKGLLKTLYGIFSILVLGVGMSLCLVWEQIILGSIIGIIGIALLVLLIPIIKGIQ